MDSQRHSGRVALITGAGSGIGMATALRMVGEGAHVVACDVNEVGLKELEAKAGSDSLMTVAGDITRQEDVDRIVDAGVQKFGQIDILANVAGIMDWFLPVHEVDDETWQRVMAVNVTGPMMLCRKVLPLMMAQNRGAIANVASVGGLGGGSAGFAYTVSKHALIGASASIAWTYRQQGIRCNTVCPGGVKTNIGTTAIPRSGWGFEQLKPWHALAGDAAEPDQIASLLSWLCSDEASNVNGAVVTADGGWSAV